MLPLRLSFESCLFTTSENRAQDAHLPIFKHHLRLSLHYSKLNMNFKTNIIWKSSHMNVLYKYQSHWISSNRQPFFSSIWAGAWGSTGGVVTDLSLLDSSNPQRQAYSAIAQRKNLLQRVLFIAPPVEITHTACIYTFRAAADAGFL